MQKLKPSHRYLRKLVLIFSIIAGLILIFALVVGGSIGTDDPSGGRIFMIIFSSLAALFWIVALLFSGPYARSLSYEIRDDEVIMHVGIITKSVKHVPFRTVTNIKINRGLLDRFVFNTGPLNIQTAGMSGSTGAEESLVGLENVLEIYEAVAARLRKFRGGMSPSAAEEETPGAGGTNTMVEILGELKAIRKSLEK